MLKIAVLVSGGGTNLQAIIDSIARGDITDTKIAAVVSNNPGAYALKRAEEAGLTTKCISPRSFESRELFNQALTDYLVKSGADLIVPGSADQRLQEQDHKYPSFSDPFLLRQGLLWPACARGSLKARRQGQRGDGAFCG